MNRGKGILVLIFLLLGLWLAWAGSGRARMASSQQEANESAAGDQLYYSYQNGTGDGIQ